MDSPVEPANDGWRVEGVSGSGCFRLGPLRPGFGDISAFRFLETVGVSRACGKIGRYIRTPSRRVYVRFVNVDERHISVFALLGALRLWLWSQLGLHRAEWRRDAAWEPRLVPAVRDGAGRLVLSDGAWARRARYHGINVAKARYLLRFSRRRVRALWRVRLRLKLDFRQSRDVRDFLGEGHPQLWRQGAGPPVLTTSIHSMFDFCSYFRLRRRGAYSYAWSMAEPYFIPFRTPHHRSGTKLREPGRGARTNATGRYETHRRVETDDGWGQLAETVEARRPTQVLLDTTRRIINRVDSPYVGFDRSINPYRGCEHGCIYCFARPTHAYLGLSPGLDFETVLIAKPDAAELLRAELTRPGYQVRPIMIGTNTDAYQPVERSMQVMQGILKVLAEFRHPVSVLTKSALILRDRDLLSEMAERGVARAMISITTQDRRLARAMEPRASTPDKRFEALEGLVGAGVPTGIMLGPMIPGLNDSELESIMERAAGAGASFAAFTVLRLPQEVAPLFKEWLEVFAPDRAKRILRHIRDMNGGRDYDPQWSRTEDRPTPFRTLIAQRYALSLKRTGIAHREATRTLDGSQFRVPPEATSGQGELFE